MTDKPNKESDTEEPDSTEDVVSSSDVTSDSEDKKSPESEFIPKDVLEQLPPEVRKIVSMQVSSIAAPRQSPIAAKINESHIDKILDLAGKDDERAYEDARESRRYGLAYVVIAMVFFVAVTILLAKDSPEMYKEILKLFAVFAGGFGGGFGVKSYIERK